MLVTPKIKSDKSSKIILAHYRDKEKPRTPTDTLSILDNGVEHYKKGKYEEAIASFDKAIEINPKLVQAWYKKGDAFYRLEKYEQAIASYSQRCL